VPGASYLEAGLSRIMGRPQAEEASSFEEARATEEAPAHAEPSMV